MISIISSKHNLFTQGIQQQNFTHFRELDFQPTIKPTFRFFKSMLHLRRSYRDEDNRKMGGGYRSLKPSHAARKFPLVKLFKAYVNVNVMVSTFRFNIHSTMNLFYVRHGSGGFSFPSLYRLFARWYEAYLLFFNLFFYDLDVIVFGTSDFKHEIFSIN
jgi:hypothetical protein